MNPRISIKLALSLITAVTIFHFSILLGIIPYEITWGGRLKNDSEMYVFETISILVNLILGCTLLIKGNYTKPIISSRVVNTILWLFLFLFVFNTIGNLFAKTNFEKLFSLLTLSFSLLIWIILRKKHKDSH